MVCLDGHGFPQTRVSSLPARGLLSLYEAMITHGWNRGMSVREAKAKRWVNNIQSLHIGATRRTRGLQLLPCAHSHALGCVVYARDTTFAPRKVTPLSKVAGLGRGWARAGVAV